MLPVRRSALAQRRHVCLTCRYKQRIHELEALRLGRRLHTSRPAYHGNKDVARDAQKSHPLQEDWFANFNELSTELPTSPSPQKRVKPAAPSKKDEVERSEHSDRGTSEGRTVFRKTIGTKTAEGRTVVGKTNGSESVARYLVRPEDNVRQPLEASIKQRSRTQPEKVGVKEQGGRGKGVAFLDLTKTIGDGKASAAVDQTSQDEGDMDFLAFNRSEASNPTDGSWYDEQSEPQKHQAFKRPVLRVDEAAEDGGKQFEDIVKQLQKEMTVVKETNGKQEDKSKMFENVVAQLQAQLSKQPKEQRPSRVFSNSSRPIPTGSEEGDADTEHQTVDVDSLSSAAERPSKRVNGIHLDTALSAMRNSSQTLAPQESVADLPIDSPSPKKSSDPLEQAAPPSKGLFTKPTQRTPRPIFRYGDRSSGLGARQSSRQRGSISEDIEARNNNRRAWGGLTGSRPAVADDVAVSFDSLRNADNVSPQLHTATKFNKRAWGLKAEPDDRRVTKSPAEEAASIPVQSTQEESKSTSDNTETNVEAQGSWLKSTFQSLKRGWFGSGSESTQVQDTPSKASAQSTLEEPQSPQIPIIRYKSKSTPQTSWREGSAGRSILPESSSEHAGPSWRTPPPSKAPDAVFVEDLLSGNGTGASDGRSPAQALSSGDHTGEAKPDSTEGVEETLPASGEQGIGERSSTIAQRKTHLKENKMAHAEAKSAAHFVAVSARVRSRKEGSSPNEARRVYQDAFLKALKAAEATKLPLSEPEPGQKQDAGDEPSLQQVMAAASDASLEGFEDAGQAPSASMQEQTGETEQTAPVSIETGGQEDFRSQLLTIDATSLHVEPLDIDQPAVPGLSYGLERVLFNPGVYQLQDPHSKVYNFDPYLQKIMPVGEFDFNALKEYKSSSQDTLLSDLATQHGKKYVGSTSSMTGTLAHFHYLLSDWRDINTNMLSQSFPLTRNSSKFTPINTAPNAIFLRYKKDSGTYAIDADKQYDSGNVLMMLGKSMEKLLTMSPDDYERYRKSDPRSVSEDERNAPEAFQFTTMGDFLMRSQLDAHDPRLPGTGMFDLKTRAVVTVRMDASDFEPMLGYEIHTMQGRMESYEKEYYDMIRSTMLKYMLQVRMGRMDGIFIAYHNVERIFGFQYVPVADMDRALHGQMDPCLGDQEFRASLRLLNEVLERATKKFPEQSLRVHFETRERPTAMYVFAEPMEETEIEQLQAAPKEKIKHFEQEMMGLVREEREAPKHYAGHRSP